mmetsp:Transcript_45158/g.104639  ORF Transcript_45158/g.104639 Transcript_45158/m.104639 type:complete len:906 (+) Transcript_45158:58-2775(+)
MRPTARVRVPLPQSGGKGAKVKDITAGAGEAQPDDPDEAENGELDEPLTASLPRSNSRQSSAGQNGSPQAQASGAEEAEQLPAVSRQRSASSPSQSPDDVHQSRSVGLAGSSLKNSLSRTNSRSRSRPSRTSTKEFESVTGGGLPAIPAQERSLSRQSAGASRKMQDAEADDAWRAQQQQPQPAPAARQRSNPPRTTSHDDVAPRRRGAPPGTDDSSGDNPSKYMPVLKQKQQKQPESARPAVGRGSTSAPPPKPAVPRQRAQAGQQEPQPQQPVQPKRQARPAGEAAQRARSEPPAGNRQVHLAKLVSKVTAHLEAPAEPLDEKGWLQETAQLELFVEEMRSLLAQAPLDNAAAPNKPSGPSRFLPDIVSKRDISVLQWDKDLRWAKQQLRRCEQEYNLLKQKMAYIDPVAQEQAANELRQVEEDIVTEQRRQKQIVAENRLRERSLVQNAVDGHEVDAKTRAVQQIERYEAEIAVWKVKNNSLHKQVQESARLLQKAQENRMLLGKKAQHMDEVVNSEEFAVKQAEHREAQEKLKQEEATLQASLGELQEQRRALQKNHEKRKRERVVELRQLAEEKRVLEERDRHSEGSLRQLRREHSREPAGTPRDKVGRAVSRSVSPKQQRFVSPSPRNPEPDSARQPAPAQYGVAPQPAPENFEEQVKEQVLRLTRFLPQGKPKVCILGSTVMHGSDTKAVVEAMAANLATWVGTDICLLTGGNTGVQEAFGNEVGSAVSMFHLALPGTKSNFMHGEDVEVLGDLGLKSAVMGEIGDLYITLEGGPKVADEARRAVLRGAIVLPISQTGGASAGSHGFPPVALKRPPCIPEPQWSSLQDALTPKEIAAATAICLRGVLSSVFGITTSREDVSQADVQRPQSGARAAGAVSPAMALRRVSQSPSDASEDV